MLEIIKNIFKKDRRRYYIEFYDRERFVIAFNCTGKKRAEEIIGKEAFLRGHSTVSITKGDKT